MAYSPSPRHLQLLRAALCAPDVAVPAWNQWRQDRGVSDADPEEARLLATIAARVGPLIPEDAGLQRLRGLRRQAWSVNMLRAGMSSDVADSLRDVGIDSLFFKGVALLPAYGADVSMRTMGDADLLVRWHQRHEAIDHLAGIGFLPLHRVPVAGMHRLDSIYPGFCMRRDDGLEIDLHWRPLHHLGHRPDLDELLFAHARRVSVGASSVVIPAPGHHVVLVSGHGIRRGSEAHLVSLCDAAQLLAVDDLDVEHVVDLARRYERLSAVRTTCMILSEVLSAGAAAGLEPVAERLEVLSNHGRSPTVADRLLHRQLTSSSDGQASRRGAVHTGWSVARTPLRNGGPVGGALAVVRRRTGIPRNRDLPRQAVWLIGRRSEAVGAFRRTTNHEPSCRPMLRLGDELAVGTTSGLDAILTSGWWYEEPEGVWSKAPEAAITFDLELGDAGVCNLAITTVPFVEEANETVTVDVRINGHTRAVWRYSFGLPIEITQRITVDAKELDHGRCEILFVIDGATSPLAAGVSADSRTLGIGFRRLAIEPIGLIGLIAELTPVLEIGPAGG